MHSKVSALVQTPLPGIRESPRPTGSHDGGSRESGPWVGLLSKLTAICKSNIYIFFKSKGAQLWICSHENTTMYPDLELPVRTSTTIQVGV
jgi:hypothetical protein